MKKVKWFSFTLLLCILFSLSLSNVVIAQKKEVKKCAYPGSPINWILRYCASLEKTGDEITLQNGKCFQSSLTDIKSTNDPCKDKERYKKFFCGLSVNKKHHKTIDDCMKDTSVRPFFAGE